MSSSDTPGPPDGRTPPPPGPEPERWDADDARRRDDPMAPPAEPCECYCLHCRRTFTSDAMWLQRVIGGRDGFDGFWMCPTPNCSGAGFTFDIFPIDPTHPANDGWSYDDDDDEDAGDEEEDDLAQADGGDAPDEALPWDDDDEGISGPRTPGEAAEYDPAEPKYRALDEMYGDEDDDDDIEGEEWKYGLQPGERPAYQGSDEGRREWEEEQKKYDMPDERPRELDWSNREEERRGGPFNDDDIPF